MTPNGWADTELYAVFHRHWGHPSDRRSFRKQGAGRFEVMLFGEPDAVVARLVTHGLSFVAATDGEALGLELLLVVPADLGGVEAGRAFDFLADVATWALTHSRRPTPGTYVRTSLCPWAMEAVLFDDPLGEDESLEQFEADGRPVRLVWAVPIYATEADLIETAGINAFDALNDRSETSVVDVGRPPLV